MLVNVSSPGNVAQFQDAKAAAAKLALTLVPLEIRSSADYDAAFQTLAKQRAEILLIMSNAVFFDDRKRIVALAGATRLPTIYSYREHVEDGGLMSYGINTRESWRRAAILVDKILKGARPGDLPVELPTKLELVINLKAAKALGLTVPPSLLARADEVIE